MTKIEEFTRQFHSINGATIKDKCKHFNEFLLSLQTNIQNEEDRDVFIKSITPKTPLEESFRFDIIIKLQRKDIIIEELKKCKRTLLRKLLKDWKLFSDIFSHITVDELINDIFIHLPFTQKLNILNGLSKNIKNEQLLNEYFVALQKKYGLTVAATVLPGCSIDIIKSTIEKYHLKLTDAHLKHIYRKDKTLVRIYFDLIKKKYEDLDLTSCYSQTLKYIARMDPILYWELSDCFSLKIKFGKHTTPTMIKHNTNVTEKGEFVFEIFHNLQLYKTLKNKGKLNAFLVNASPNRHDQFINRFEGWTFHQFIKHIPISIRYDVLSIVFSEKYQRDLLSYPKYFTEDLLKITPITTREKVLNIKIEEDKGLSYLYSPAVSIPQFKERLQHSSDSGTRLVIAKQLYETCVANEDTNALLEVLKYILNRHRNDIAFIERFAECVTYWPKKEELTGEHWECLWHILKILHASRMNYYMFSQLYEGYLNYLVKNNKPYQGFIEYCVKLKAEDKISTFYYELSDKRYVASYFDQLARCIDGYKDSNKYASLVIAFLHDCGSNYVRNNVPILKYQYMFKYLNKADWQVANILKNIVKIDNEEIHELFWKDQDDKLAFLWYAKHRPDIFKENIDKVLSRYDELKIKSFIRKVKYFVDAETVNKIKTIALKALEDNKCDKQSRNAIKALSILAPETFLEIIPSFEPHDAKADLDEETEKVTLQQTIAQSLTNIEDVLKSFPLISKFCIGDYLKFTLSALYSAFYQAPEKYVQNFLATFTNTAVSVRKHVLALGRHVLTATDFQQILNDWTEKEDNLSVRNILFRKIVEYFIENPYETFWNLLQNNINRVDINDGHFYDFLIKFQKIPLDYRSRYIELIYKQISINSDSEIQQKKYQFVNDIYNSTIEHLNEDFVNLVIKDTVCSKTDSNFHWRCVFFTLGEKQMRFFEENFKLFKNFLDQSDIGLSQKLKVRSRITKFFFAFFDLSIELKQNNTLIEKFMTSWNQLFKREEFTKEYMQLAFLNIYFVTDFKPFEMGLKVNDLLHEYIKNYNNIIHLFCAQLNIFLRKANIVDYDLSRFVNGLFKPKDEKDVNTFIAVMYFLPRTLPEIDNCYSDYLPILNAIEECELSVVGFHFDLYLAEIDL